MTTAPQEAPPGRGGPAGYVAKMARASGTNFFYAFLTLPRPRREGICAVYAFCRAADDAVDDAPSAAAAEAAVAAWRAELDRLFAGAPEHPVSRALAPAVERYALPKALFEQVLDGVAMDMAPRRFASWDELALYCGRVAGAVGRLSVRVFGVADERADAYADTLGEALQLTNILRDIGPDAALGRCYLPRDEMDRFGVDEAALLVPGEARAALLRFEAARARERYARAAELVRGRERTLCAAEVMGAIYRRLLDAVERRGFPVQGPVVRLPRPVKLYVAARVFARCRRARSAE